MKNFFYILLFILFSWWIYLRIYGLWSPSFWIDEWYSSIVSYYTYLNNFEPFIESWRYYFHQFFFTISQVLSFSFFWINDFSARLPSVLFSILSMLLWVIFSYELFKDNKYKYLWTLFVSFLLFFSNWKIIWAREARFYELLSLLFLLWVYFIFKFDLTKNKKYFLGFTIISWIWSIFHPFLLSFFILWFFYIFYIFILDYLENKNLKNLISNNYHYIIFILIWFLLYFWVNNLFWYISNWSLNFWNSIPKLNDLSNELKSSYEGLYLSMLFKELWLFFPIFLLGNAYFIYIKKYSYFIIFFWIFFVNFYFISQKWIMLHSRYLYHLFSIIIIIWAYIYFLLISFIYDKYIKFRNIFFKTIFLFISISCLFLFNFSIFPKSTYYIDSTSPKPNFKAAYSFIKNNFNENKIISGFPHICFWYNLENKDICEYSFRVDLTWIPWTKEKLKEETNHNYTNTPYINNISQINNQIFVIDDLTFRMLVDVDILEYVIKNCDKIFEDLWDWNKYNSIQVYKCNI